MILRPARESDFLHLETFVWQAIFPAFDLPGLSVEQQAENDALVEMARQEVLLALDKRDSVVFVAIDLKARTLAGYITADAAPKAYAEIQMLVVKRSFWGKGVAGKLLAEATNYIGVDRAVSLSVRNFNNRAKAFFKKHGFTDTGETTGNHALPRTLMLREANEVTETPTMNDKKKTGYADDFPSSANEPVFEALPDYRLATDEAPLFETGENKLSTVAPEDLLFSETTLDEKTLTELEAFIARARALKGSSAPAKGLQTVPTKPRARQEEPQPPLKPPSASQAAPSSEKDYTYNSRNIPFEVDFGDGRVEDVKFTPADGLLPTTSSLSHGEGSGENQKQSIKEASIQFQGTPANPESQRTSSSEIRKVKPSFEFAFSAATDSTEASSDTASSKAQPIETKQDRLVATAKRQPAASTSPVTEGSVRKTKECPDCQTELPQAARFCFSCGYPQPEVGDSVPTGTKDPEEDILVLEELPLDPPQGPRVKVSSEGSTKAAPDQKSEVEAKEMESGERTAAATGVSKSRASKSAPGATSSKKYTMAELRLAFREHFQERVIAYFGVLKLKKYYTALEENNNFQQLRDGSLTNLLNWINGGERTYASVARRINDTMADLTEYFIVEVAGELSSSVLPQRLLRHQSVNWDTVDLFKLVMDYLDFEAETERVYTDFVSMPARALRNATNAFLCAGKDERIFFICDQSLISQAKNGFAVTDAGMYWKNVLQPAGSALFSTMESVSLGQGHLEIDGQFFNAGARLNLKMAVLLDKLRRIDTRN